jgi:hypothetical protein
VTIGFNQDDMLVSYKGGEIMRGLTLEETELVSGGQLFGQLFGPIGITSNSISNGSVEANAQGNVAQSGVGTSTIGQTGGSATTILGQNGGNNFGTIIVGAVGASLNDNS